MIAVMMFIILAAIFLFFDLSLKGKDDEIPKVPELPYANGK